MFKLNLYNDLLHTSSAIWAGVAAYLSRHAATNFLKLFWELYFFGGLMGTAIGSGYLDLGFIINGILDLPFKFKFLSSVPHLALGGIAAYSGFVVASRP